MQVDPYKTAIGSHINVKKLETLLNEFIIKSDDVDTLNYEYLNHGDTKLVFITGKNEMETNLPVWNHPLLLTDFRNNEWLFVDVRQFVRIKQEDFIDLEHIVSNRPGYEFTVVKALYMLFLKDTNDIGITDNIALAFSAWISSSFRAVFTLGIEEVIKLEIVTLHYMYCLLSGVNNNDNVDTIHYKISKVNKNVRGNIKYIQDVLKDVNNDPLDATDLVSNIDKAVNSPLISNISTSVLYNVVSNTWNGVNSNENITMAFDNIPTLIAILYVSANNKSFKHSKLANILNSNKRAIKIDDFVKTITLQISDQKAQY